ncbi:unnamed protein product [Cochlearia groenlandica]
MFLLTYWAFYSNLFTADLFLSTSVAEPVAAGVGTSLVLQICSLFLFLWSYVRESRGVVVSLPPQDFSRRRRADLSRPSRPVLRWFCSGCQG